MHTVTATQAVRMPWDAVRLVGRFLVPLVLWFSGGEVVRFLLVQASSRVAHGDHLQVRQALAMLLIGLVVLTTLVVVAGMLFSLSPALPSLRDRATGPRTFVATVSRALPPFVVIYLAWGLFLDDVRGVLFADVSRHTASGDFSEAGRVYTELDLRYAAAIAVVSWVARILLERRNSRTEGVASGALVAFFEVMFTLYGTVLILRMLGAVTGYLTSRVAWVETVDVLRRVGEAVPGWAAVLRLAGDLAPHLADALLLPLVWLAIAAVVYGVGLRGRSIVKGTPLARLGEMPTGRWSLALDELTSGVRGKYVPLLQTALLTLRAAGSPALAVFCVCYVACGWLAERAQRGAAMLIGPDHTVAFWDVVLVPLQFGSALLDDVSRVAVLAVMVDLVLRRLAVARETSAAENQLGALRY